MDKGHISSSMEHKNHVNNDREKFAKTGKVCIDLSWSQPQYTSSSYRRVCIAEPCDEPDKFVKFERWLHQNGTILPKLELKVCGTATPTLVEGTSLDKKHIVMHHRTTATKCVAVTQRKIYMTTRLL